MGLETLHKIVVSKQSLFESNLFLFLVTPLSNISGIWVVPASKKLSES